MPDDAPQREWPHKDIPEPIGVGMPYWLLLCDFGEMVRRAFGHVPYLVGSALEKRDPRDIDVRLILSWEEFERRVDRRERQNFSGTGWAYHCAAWSVFGTQLVGKPIDFQIQHEGCAHFYQLGKRPALPIAHFPPAWPKEEIP